MPAATAALPVTRDGVVGKVAQHGFGEGPNVRVLVLVRATSAPTIWQSSLWDAMAAKFLAATVVVSAAVAQIRKATLYWRYPSISGYTNEFIKQYIYFGLHLASPPSVLLSNDRLKWIGRMCERLHQASGVMPETSFRLLEPASPFVSPLERRDLARAHPRS